MFCISVSLESECKADDVKPDVKKQRIKVPQAKAVVTPIGTVLLRTGEYAIIEHDSDFIVRPHPTGLVEVSKKKYPNGLTIIGKFAGGSGAETEQTFAGPYIALVKAVAGQKGIVEIDSIPLGLDSESDIVQLTLLVNQLPLPPPDVLPNPPIPTPPIPPTPVVTYPDAGFVVLEDLDIRTPADALTFDFRAWDKLPIGGDPPRYRFYSVKSPDAIRLGYVKLYESTGKKLPIILAVKPDGSLIESKERPLAFSEAEAFVRKIVGK